MISVILPVKNRDFELKRCLESILSQTITDFEVLVVDDKSDIDIKKTVDSFDDPRLLYFENSSKISNANVCRNIGLRNAKGDFIAMMDSDDTWKPEHLEFRLKFLNENNCDACFGSVEIDRNGIVQELISRGFNENERFIDYIFSGGFAPTPTHFYKTKAALEVKFDETFYRHQDWDFSIRFAENYNFAPCSYVSCTVYWGKNEGAKVHAESSRKFYDTYGSHMSISSKKKFLGTIINQLNQRWNKKDQIDRKYFVSEFIKVEPKISLFDFVMIQKRHRGIYKILNRLKYFKYLIFRT